MVPAQDHTQGNRQTSSQGAASGGWQGQGSIWRVAGSGKLPKSLYKALDEIVKEEGLCGRRREGGVGGSKRGCVRKGMQGEGGGGRDQWGKAPNSCSLLHPSDHRDHEGQGWGTSGGVGTRGEDPQGASWSLAPAIYLLCCSCLANL